MSEHITSDEPYLLVEEVAERLGLPLSVLLHRVEAGDIPARRVERADGLHYALRLGDLGIELDDRGLRSAAIEDDSHDRDEEAPGGAVETEEPSGVDATAAPAEPTVENAIFSAFDGGPAPLPAPPDVDRDATGEGGDDDEDAGGSDTGSDPEVAGGVDAEGVDGLPWQAAAATPPWVLRPREPQEPPAWLSPDRVAAAAPEQDAASDGVEVVGEVEGVDEYMPPPFEPDFDEAVEGMPAGPPQAFPDAADDLDADQDTAVAELAVPPPSRQPPVSLVDTAAPGPRGDLASMSLDARELVAGLLDRWERTLEQRIYTEQRQRFQAELVARQNMVKQLQMELHTARAEHAAAQAEKDRMLAGKERELADRERDLAETRRAAEETERMLAPQATRRRRWFWSRDD